MLTWRAAYPAIVTLKRFTILLLDADWRQFAPYWRRMLLRLTQMAMGRRIFDNVNCAYLDQTWQVQDMRPDMIGVVLWCDLTAGKAVIWCDDQGDLAFFNQPDCSQQCTEDRLEISVGDWVTFDLELQDSFRMAKEVQLLREPGSPHLVQDLVSESAIAPLGQPGHADKWDASKPGLGADGPFGGGDSSVSDQTAHPQAVIVSPVSIAAHKHTGPGDFEGDDEAGQRELDQLEADRAGRCIAREAGNVVTFPLDLAKRRRRA